MVSFHSHNHPEFQGNGPLGRLHIRPRGLLKNLFGSIYGQSVPFSANNWNCLNQEGCMTIQLKSYLFG